MKIYAPSRAAGTIVPEMRYVKPSGFGTTIRPMILTKFDLIEVLHVWPPTLGAIRQH